MAEKGRTIVQIKIAKLIGAKCVERKGRNLEGIVIPCNLCDKTFRSRNGFRLHRRHNKNYLICDFFFIFFSL